MWKKNREGFGVSIRLDYSSFDKKENVNHNLHPKSVRIKISVINKKKQSRLMLYSQNIGKSLLTVLAKKSKNENKAHCKIFIVKTW